MMKTIDSHCRPLRTLCLLLLSGLICSATAPAQDATVKLRFVSFPKVDHEEVVELQIGKAEGIKVELPTNSISKAFEVPAMATWALGKTTTDAEGEPSFLTYGATPAPAYKEQLVLVIRKGKSDSDGLTLITMDGRTGSFAGGTYIFFNASKTDIACELGETKFAIRPLQHKLVAPKPSETRGDRNYLHAHVYFRKGEEARPFYTSTWRFNEKARSMVFLYHDPNNQRLRLHTIREYVP